VGKPVLHQHAFWVYGVIVGLAVKEALSSVLPNLLTFIANPPDAPFTSAADGWKLVVFLVVTIRFYLGSAVFFHSHHNVETNHLTRGYVTDFLSGVMHFILFFAWSLTFKVSPSTKHEFVPTAYETLLAIILLYDFLWWAICRGTKGAAQVRYWSFVNLATVVVATVIHLISVAANALQTVSEGITLLPVFFASIADIVGMAKGEQPFAKWIRALLQQTEPPTTEGGA